MAGIMSGGVEIARFVAPISVISNRPIFSMDTLSLRTKSGSQGDTQRWEIQARLEPFNGSSELMVHMITTGHDTTFDVRMPQVYYRSVKTTATAALSVTNALAAASSAMTVSNNATKMVAKGEFFQFANHNKVYMATTERSGDGVMGFFPTLRFPVPANTLIKTGTSVNMKCRFNTDTIIGMIYSDGVLMDMGQINIKEDLSA